MTPSGFSRPCFMRKVSYPLGITFGSIFVVRFEGETEEVEATEFPLRTVIILLTSSGAGRDAGFGAGL